MDLAPEDLLNMASAMKSFDPPKNNEGPQKKYSLFSPYLIADHDAMASRGKDARSLEYPQKRNLGRWRNINWIFSVRSGNPKIPFLHRVE
jgi:hypothetical protein